MFFTIFIKGNNFGDFLFSSLDDHFQESNLEWFQIEMKMTELHPCIQSPFIGIGRFRILVEVGRGVQTFSWLKGPSFSRPFPQTGNELRSVFLSPTPLPCCKKIKHSAKPFPAFWAHSECNLSATGYFNFMLKIS